MTGCASRISTPEVRQEGGDDADRGAIHDFVREKPKRRRASSPRSSRFRRTIRPEIAPAQRKSSPNSSKELASGRAAQGPGEPGQANGDFGDQPDRTARLRAGRRDRQRHGERGAFGSDWTHDPMARLVDGSRREPVSRRRVRTSRLRLRAGAGKGSGAALNSGSGDALAFVVARGRRPRLAGEVACP